jgi:hypothetical protein
MAGHWQLYRYSPENGLAMDSRQPNGQLGEYMGTEGRFNISKKKNEVRFAGLVEKGTKAAELKWEMFDYISKFHKENEAK